MAEQADALRSGRSGLYAHVGSTPTFGIFLNGEAATCLAVFYVGRIYSGAMHFGPRIGRFGA